MSMTCPAWDSASTKSAMRSFGGVWTEERLDAFLKGPAALVPGTTMPDEGIADGDLRARIVEALKQLK